MRAEPQLQAAAGPVFPSAARLTTLQTGLEAVFMCHYFPIIN